MNIKRTWTRKRDPDSHSADMTNGAILSDIAKVLVEVQKDLPNRFVKYNEASKRRSDANLHAGYVERSSCA
jgi:hypothetical protein